MKAYVVVDQGNTPELTEVPVPDPGPGEVRVRVAAASINGFDLAVAYGAMAPYFEHRYPVVLGRDFAGAVDAIGPEVDGYEVGDRVFGVIAKPYLSEGSFAEYTTAVVDSAVAHTPASIDDVTAASLSHTGATALACLDSVDLDGATLLVVGATGAVGTLVVQLAAAAGARVIATARTDEGRALLERLGADAVVDYTGDLAGEVAAVAPDGVDVLLHLAGDADELAPLVRNGGMFISPLVYTPEMFGHDRLGFVPIASYPTVDHLTKLADLIDDGRLEVVVHEVYPLDDVHLATGAWGRNTIGNIVVTTDVVPAGDVPAT